MSTKKTKQLEEDIHAMLAKLETDQYDDVEQMLADYAQAQKYVHELEKRLESAKNTLKKMK